jgi:sec-independent protein translocase protein TatA
LLRPPFAREVLCAMPNIGPVELIIVLVIALLVIGPGKLPDVGSALGKSIREFRKAATDVQDSVKLDAPPAATPAPVAPAPVASAPVAPAPVASVPAPAPAPAAEAAEAAQDGSQPGA